jgi:hypothetical protein
MSLDLGIEMGRLGAEGAVLGTVPRLGAYYGAQKHPVALVLEGHLPCKRYEVRKPLPGKFGKRESVFKGYLLFFFEKFFGNYVKNVYFWLPLSLKSRGI